MVDALMQEADVTVSALDAIAFGRGPGSFIGLRIAAGITQGIAFAADLPVIPVSSLAALAQTSGRPWVLAAIDARMQEVYWGAYRLAVADSASNTATSCVQLLGEEKLSPAAFVELPVILPEMPRESISWFGAGSGWRVPGPDIGSHLSVVQDCQAEIFPRAAAIAQLGMAAWQRGAAVPAEQAQPVYLRDDVAKKSVKS